MMFFKRKERGRNADFEAFKSEVSWFFTPKTKVKIEKTDNIQINDLFKNTFPELTSLINKARQTHLTINAEYYVLFAWDRQDGKISGWLNKRENPDSCATTLIEEHQLLLGTIGGIKESFNQPEDSFLNYQNFMFLGSECSKGIGHYDDYYSMKCEDAEYEKIEYSHLVVFAYEANGALTLYDPATKEVLLLSHDHDYDHVKILDNQPAYTFHTFDKAKKFKDYVEELARQWRDI